MCVAILQPANQRLTIDEARASWNANSHGGGVGYIDGDVVKTEKVLNDFDKFWEMYSRLCDAYGNKRMMVHFRIKTHGEATIENTHPFHVYDNLLMMHNGVISNVTSKTSAERSDTRVFAEDYCRKLPDGWFQNEIVQELLADYIGSSKLVFLHANESFWIINENKFGGHWGRDGFWFSNESYKPKVYNNVTTFTSKTQEDFAIVDGKVVRFRFDKNNMRIEITGDIYTAGGSFNIEHPFNMIQFGKLYMPILTKLNLDHDNLFSDILTNYLDWMAKEVHAA